MQPGVTVALATVWLAGATGVLSATLYPTNPSLDQYSPQVPPNHHEVTQGPQGHANWKLKDPSKDLLAPKIDQTSKKVYLPIETTNLKPLWEKFVHFGYSDRSYGIGLKQVDSDLSFKDGIVPFQREDSIDYDSFQDQGPGSIQVYRLNLSKENSLFDRNLSENKIDAIMAKNKLEENKEENNESGENKLGYKRDEYKPKESKKANKLKENQSEQIIPLQHLQMKFKTEKEVSSPEPNFSNQLEEDSENESFEVGGVPELQIGCEGVEANFRDKRSASENITDKVESEIFDYPPLNITYVSLVHISDKGLGSSIVYDDDMDVLLRLRKLEEDIQNERSDTPIDLLEESDQSEEFPERGDMGSYFQALKKKKLLDKKNGSYLLKTQNQPSLPQSSVLKRRKRDSRSSVGDMWGYGEDEGIMPYDELQTDEKRVEEDRRINHMRIKQEEERRRNNHREAINHHSDSEDRREERERIMDDYNRRLNEREREQIKQEEERRRMKHDEKRRVQEEHRRTAEHRRNWPIDYRRQEEYRIREEERRRLDKEGRRQEDERKRVEEERRRSEEDRRRNSERRRQEEERRRQEEERRRYNEQRMKEESERRRNQNGNLTPSNLMHPDHHRPDRRQEEENEKKLRNYIQRNTPIVVESRQPLDDSTKKAIRDRGINQPENLTRSTHPYDNRHQRKDREPVWLEQKKAIESTRPYDKSGLRNSERRHEPSSLNEMVRRNETNDIRMRPDMKRLEEETRRLDKKRLVEIEEEKSRADRRRIEHEAKRLEEEDRRKNSIRYEEDRIWHERMIQQAERMRQEWMHETNRRSQAERRPVWSKGYQPSRPNEKGYQYPEPNNKGYQPPSDLNNKGYQLPPDLSNKGYQSPSNLNNKGYQPSPDLNNKGYQPPLGLNNKGYQSSRVNLQFERDRKRLGQEKRRMEAESQVRNGGQDDRYQAQKRRVDSVRNLEEYRRRQKYAELDALPVSATVIVGSGASGTNSSSPPVFSKGGFRSEIDFPVISPNHRGIQAAGFPAPVTRIPLIKGPKSCVWAVIQCCPATDHVVSCFESSGCPGVNWDSNPCNPAVTQAAKNEVAKFYSSTNQNSRH